MVAFEHCLGQVPVQRVHVPGDKVPTVVNDGSGVVLDPEKDNQLFEASGLNLWLWV